MEAKKSKKAAIENQRGSWLLMGLVVALAFMFVSFEWTQHDVRVAALSPDDESIFVTELVPITFLEEKLEPPPPPETKVTELFEIVENNTEVTDKNRKMCVLICMMPVSIIRMIVFILKRNIYIKCTGMKHSKMFMR